MDGWLRSDAQQRTMGTNMIIGVEKYPRDQIRFKVVDGDPYYGYYYDMHRIVKNQIVKKFDELFEGRIIWDQLFQWFRIYGRPFLSN